SEIYTLSLHDALPILHFQSEINGVVFEPFAASCHGGVSNWIAQPSFRTDLYLRELVLTGDNLGSWAGYPFDTSRTGTFLTGTRRSEEHTSELQSLAYL